MEASLMDLRRTLPLVLIVSAGCNPYANHSGDYWAGSVDPIKFPAEYRGVGFAKNTSFGQISGVFAQVDGVETEYFAFPLVDVAPGDPLTIGPPDPSPTAMVQPTFAAPRAFVFDPMPEVSPFPTAPKCVVPKGYQRDAQRDAFPLDEQGPVFTALPDNTGIVGGIPYLPLISQVTATSNGENCNDVHSEEGVVANAKVTTKSQPAPAGSLATNPTGVPDAPPHFVAWAVIDPSACVSDIPQDQGGCIPGFDSGVTVQKIGWFDHLLLAYIDGGYVPFTPMSDGTNVIISQNLYVPDTIIDPDTMMPVPNTAEGSPNDILEHARGDAGYSPICHVLFFTPADPTLPETSASQIDMSTIQDAGHYIACLQAQ
jgi:hypothetical protein